MQDDVPIRALYSALAGVPYQEGEQVTFTADSLYDVAAMLFRFFSPTDAQIGALLFYKFAGAHPTEAVPDAEASEPERQTTPKEAEEQGGSVPVLEAGSVPWKVIIDGIPGNWQLRYEPRHLPVQRGDTCYLRDKRYRVSRVYMTTLHLTSEESEVYGMNHQEVIA